MDPSCHSGVGVGAWPSLAPAHGRLCFSSPVRTEAVAGACLCRETEVRALAAASSLRDGRPGVKSPPVFALQGAQCAEQIRELVLSSCEESCGKSAADQLDALLSDPARPVGLLLSERFINVPPQIALPMHQQLQKELAEAHSTNGPCGKCSFYLLISKTFVEAGKNNPKKKWGNQEKEELMFANAEEEFFYEKAVLKFNYSVQEESDTCLGGRWSFDDVPMKPLRTVMLVPGDQMDAIMGDLKEHLSL